MRLVLISAARSSAYHREMPTCDPSVRFLIVPTSGWTNQSLELRSRLLALPAEEDIEGEFFLFAAIFLILDCSGSLMNTHSLPREVHFEQGYCRLHLTFDSAHA